MNKISGLFLVVVLAFFGWAPTPAQADDLPLPVYCFCSDNLTKITAENYKTVEVFSSGCERVLRANCTTSKVVPEPGAKYDTCEVKNNETDCKDAFFKWNEDKEKLLKDAGAAETGLQAKKSKFIPECALKDTLTAECRDINIFLSLLINIANYLFSIIGALSLLMFVYAGFVLITSQGNAERVTQGKNILVAVVIGLAVAFGGYILIQFLGDVIGAKSDFTLLQSK